MSGRRTTRVHDERTLLRAAGLLAVVLALVTVLAFAKGSVTAPSFELRGTFTSANRLKPGSEVRIAGVQVGEVRGVERGPDGTAIVRMGIEPRGLPIRDDATLAIRPRLVLEGNFYVDVRPGTPQGRPLESGGVVPVSRTTVPVQVDEVLDTFDLATRDGFHAAVRGLATGFGPGEPGTTPAPRVTGARGARRTVRALSDALDGFGRVARAARGAGPGDLGRAVVGTADATSALARDPRALAGLVSNLATVTGALAAEDRALAATFGELERLLARAPRGLRALDRTLPRVERFAVDARPPVRAAPGLLVDADRFLTQLDRLSGPRELPAVLSGLRPITRTLPALLPRLTDLARRVTPVSECLSNTVVPALNMTLEDGANSTGDPAWLDMLHAFTGVTGFASAFDGNGVAIRVGVTQGQSTLANVLDTNALVQGPPLRGVRPVWLGYGVDPVYDPGSTCSEQPLPRMNSRSGGPPTWMRGSG